MDLYYYDYETHVFTQRDAAPDCPPEELPADFPATTLPPPAPVVFHDIVFDTQAGGWAYQRWPLQRIQAELEKAIDAHIAEVMHARGYDSITSCITYLGSTNARWDTDARDALAWRTAVWSRAYELLNAWSAGEIDMLTPEQVIAALPEIEWTHQEDPA